MARIGSIRSHVQRSLLPDRTVVSEQTVWDVFAFDDAGHGHELTFEQEHEPTPVEIAARLSGYRRLYVGWQGLVDLAVDHVAVTGMLAAERGNLSEPAAAAVDARLREMRRQWRLLAEELDA